jgi:glycolate oxidase iron-sulfur subunit
MASKAEFEEVKKFEKDLGQCMKCGFCTFWCPVYQEERIESSVARGKNMMVRALLAGDLEYTKEYAERLNKCTLCMTCTANCPAKANIPNVIVAARADKVKAKGINFPYNIVYRWLLPRRRLFGNVVRFASWFQGIFLPRTQGTIRHLSMFLSALGKGRHIPQIAPRFLRQMVPVVNKPTVAEDRGMKVGYFTGCMTDFVFPEVGKKIINFLARQGVEVVVPREQGCCGAPVFLGAGDLATGRKLADTNVKAFADFDYVVADCATCSSAMKDYVKFLADTPERQEAYAKFAEKIKDITEFLVDVLKLPPSAYRAVPEAKGKKVTWHDPCHLNRHMGITRQPREILKSIPDIEYVEMPNADRCCGMAGSFSIYFYDVSKKIADKKMEGIETTGADIVVTDCPGCEFQLIDTTMRHDSPVKVMHIMELLE